MRAFLTMKVMPGGFLRVRHLVTQKWRNEGRGVRVLSCDDVAGFCDVIVEVETDIQLEKFSDVVWDELAGLADVNRIVSFIVLRPSERKASLGPTSGYFFINVIPQMSKAVQGELVKIRGISSADVVSGEYDIIAKTSIPPNQMSDHTTEIQLVSGVRYSETLIPHDVFRRMPTQK